MSSSIINQTTSANNNNSNPISPYLSKSSELYYTLAQPKYIDLEFFKQYIDKEPNFKEFSAVVYLRTYSRFIPDLFSIDFELAKTFTLARRERWCETILRVVEYSIGLDKVSAQEDLKIEAKELYDSIYNLRIFPSGRTLWVGGSKAVASDSTANFNCSFTALKSLTSFGDAFYLLLVGAGVGFSVENKYVSRLPVLNTAEQVSLHLEPIQTKQSQDRLEHTGLFLAKRTVHDTACFIEATTLTSADSTDKIKSFLTTRHIKENNNVVNATSTFNSSEEQEPTKKINVANTHIYDLRIEVGDSKGGWVTSYLSFLLALTQDNIASITINFDNVRPEGSILKQFGGRSSGPKPLYTLFKKSWWFINRDNGSFVANGGLLGLDLITTIASIVVAGGVRRCLPENTLVHTKEGLIKIKDLNKGDLVLSGKDTYSKVVDVWNTGYKKVTKIKTQLGDFESSEDHRWAVLVDVTGKLKWVAAKDLSSEDKLVLVPSSIEGVDTFLPEFVYDYPKHSTTCKKINIPTLHTDMAWFFGMLHGNGTVFAGNRETSDSNPYVSIACADNYPYIHPRVVRCLEKFGLNVLPYLTPNEGCSKPRVSSKQLAVYLSQFKQSNKPFNVPNFILKGSREIRSAYIAGILDSDGSLGKTDNKIAPVRVMICIHKEFLQELQSVLASLNIQSKLLCARGSVGNWKTLYSLDLIGIEAITKFHSLVGKYSVKWQEHGEHQLTRTKEQSSFTLSKSYMQNAPSHIKDLFSWEDSNRSLSFHLYQDLVGEQNYIPVSIKSVTQTTEEKLMFDIQVEDSECFVINAGFLVHNSSLIGLGDSHNITFRNCKLSLFNFQHTEVIQSLEQQLKDQGFSIWEVADYLNKDYLNTDNTSTTLIEEALAIIERIDNLDPMYRYRETRTMSNNSLITGDVLSIEEIRTIFESIKSNGEPGFINLKNSVARKNTFSTRPNEEINQYPAAGVNPCCLVANTEVLTKQGIFKIKDIVDTPVEIWNGIDWETTEFKQTRHNQAVYTVTLLNGSTITATGYHRFVVISNDTFLKGEYKEEIKQLKDLHIGDLLLTNNSVTKLSAEYKVKSIQYSHVADKVYCCTVPSNHRFTLGNSVITMNSEIILSSEGVCNLTTLNLLAFVKQKDSNSSEISFYLDTVELLSAERLVTRMGSRITLVEMFSPRWTEVLQHERLLGVSMTGICEAFNKLGWNHSGTEVEKLYENLHSYSRLVANEYHRTLGIPESLLVTTLKPEGCLPIEYLRATNKGLLLIDELNPKFKITEKSEPGFYSLTNLDLFTSDNHRITKLYINKPVEYLAKITLNTGRIIETTLNHPLSVRDKWVEAQHIEPGMILDRSDDDFYKGTYIPYKFDKEFFKDQSLGTKSGYLLSDTITIPEYMTEDLAYVLGYLSINFDDTKPSVLELTSSHLDRLYKFANKFKKVFNVTLSTWYEKKSAQKLYILNLDNEYVNFWLRVNKLLSSTRSPLAVRSSTIEHLYSYLAGVIDASGTVFLNKRSVTKNKPTSSYYVRKAYLRRFEKTELFDHLQQVFESVGIATSRINVNRVESKKVGYKENATGIMSVISLLKKATNLKAVREVSNRTLAYKHRGTNLPFNWTDLYDETYTSSRWGKHHKNEYFIVKSVDIVPARPTYDIEVEDSHYYYQGRIKSHNTISQLPLVSSGIHQPYSPFYKRRIRISSFDPIAKALKDLGVPVVPQYGEDLDSCDTWVFTFLIKTEAKIRSIDEPIEDQLERYRSAYKYYAEHNVSCTITVDPDKNEYEKAAEWMRTNWNDFIGLSFLQKFDSENSPYPNMPYESISEEEYYSQIDSYPKFTESELVKLISEYEVTSEEYGLENDCAGGACPVR